MTRVTRSVAEAAAALRDGGLVAFATETVYGLGANATSDDAVARVFDAKGRPQFNPLIVHVPTITQALVLGVFNDTARQLAEAFWPGPLTLVVPRMPECPVSLLASAGLDSIAIRVPGHDQARALLKAAGVPIIAPSANPSGLLSPTCAEHVIKGLGDRIDVVLDGGQCAIGLESTVIGCLDDTPVLFRPGGLERTAIEVVLGRPLPSPESNSEAPVSPGTLSSHYATVAPLRLNATRFHDAEAVLAFGPDVPAHTGPMLNLSPRGDLQEAAANLFAMLHALDEAQPQGITVMPIPQSGLGLAINDRLQRAAAGQT